jgi:hypothetical protein
VIWFVAGDFIRRAGYIVAFDRPHLHAYLGGVAESALFWSVLVYVAARRRGLTAKLVGGAFVVLFAFSAGVEGAFHAFYNIYLPRRAVPPVDPLVAGGHAGPRAAR